MYNDYDPNNINNNVTNNTKYPSYKTEFRSSEYNEDVSIIAWIGILILLAIPIVNLITIIAIAFTHGNETLKNFGKASIIVGGISILFIILINAI